MAELTGMLSPGELDFVYTRTAVPVGTRIRDDEGGEYIFLRGVASTVAGSWVTYDNNFDTTLLAADALGPVAVAKAAIVANKWGWYQIWGTTVACAKEYIEDNSVDIGRSSTNGYVGGGATAGDYIYGAICRSATEDDSANTTTTFQIYYPYVDDATASH